MKKLLLTVAAVGCFTGAFSQAIQVTNQAAVYFENFNTLDTNSSNSSNLPAGWIIEEVGTSGSANGQYRTGTGSLNSGDIYSFGQAGSTERALGSLASNSLAPYYGVKLVNNSGAPITMFTVQYTMEQYRYAGRTAPVNPDSILVSYGVNQGALSAASGWTTIQGLNSWSQVITGSSVIVMDGNAPGNNLILSSTVNGVNIAVNDTLYIRFFDLNIGGSDDALAIDSFFFTGTGSVPVKYNSFTAAQSAKGVVLNWSTASEVNNNVFEVERSLDGAKYTTIGKVKGAGNSTTLKNYSFVDAGKSVSTACYRLKQIDFNGKSEWSKVVCVDAGTAAVADLITTPNPFNNELTVTFGANGETTAAIEVIDMLGKVHYTGSENLVKGTNTFTVNTASLPTGVYFIRISNGGHTKTQRIIKK